MSGDFEKVKQALDIRRVILRDLILAGYIEFDNVELGRNRPAGTMTVAPRWKNTA